MKKFNDIHEVVEFFDAKLDIADSEDHRTGQPFTGKIYETVNGTKYWVTFKRGFFRAFDYYFENEEGIGESLDKDCVEFLLDKNVDYILYTYQSGKIYSLSPLKLKQYAEREDTIRETDSGLVTYSVPIDYLNRWDFPQSYSSINKKVLKEKLEKNGKLLLKFDSGSDKIIYLYNTEFLDDLVKVDSGSETHWFDPEKVEKIFIPREF